MSALPAIVLSSKQKKEIGLKRSVPEWMTNGFDVFLALFLQYHGWTTLAVVTFLTMIFQTVLFGTNKKSSTQKEEEVTK